MVVGDGQAVLGEEEAAAGLDAPAPFVIDLHIEHGGGAAGIDLLRGQLRQMGVGTAVDMGHDADLRVEGNRVAGAEIGAPVHQGLHQGAVVGLVQVLYHLGAHVGEAGFLKEPGGLGGLLELQLLRRGGEGQLADHMVPEHDLSVRREAVSRGEMLLVPDGDGLDLVHLVGLNGTQVGVLAEANGGEAHDLELLFRLHAGIALEFLGRQDHGDGRSGRRSRRGGRRRFRGGSGLPDAVAGAQKRQQEKGHKDGKKFFHRFSTPLSGRIALPGPVQGPERCS